MCAFKSSPPLGYEAAKSFGLRIVFAARERKKWIGINWKRRFIGILANPHRKGIERSTSTLVEASVWRHHSIAKNNEKAY